MYTFIPLYTLIYIKHNKNVYCCLLAITDQKKILNSSVFFTLVNSPIYIYIW